MKFSIVPLYLGKRTNIYTIQFESDELSEYEKFVYENHDIIPNAVFKLDVQLKNIANKHGIVEQQFKRESPPEYSIFKINDTKEWLRLYCIKYSRVAIVVGGGGIKDKKKFKLSENSELLKVRDSLMSIEDIINKNIELKNIKITDKGFEGNLTLEEN